MGIASRAIVLSDDQILVMHRNKRGNEYFTLVGGTVKSGETAEQTLVREVKEETGLNITDYRLVFIESHPEPKSTQYTYLCEAEGDFDVALQNSSEEALMNKLETNNHTPMWVD